MNKVYITDLDHTFLRTNLSLSDFTKKVWNEMSQCAYVSIATARSFYSATHLLQGFTINAPMILLDGSFIVSPEKKIIDAKFINEDVANALIKEAISFSNLYPFSIGLKDEYLNESFDFPLHTTKVQEHLLENFKKDPRLKQCKEIHATEKTFKLVYMGSFEEMNPLTQHLKNLYSKYFEFKLSPENYSGGYFLTILHTLGDKAHGLSKLSEYLERDLSEMTVFGDSINDIGMFKLAGVSVAVNNALDEAKEHAKIVSEYNNDEDAVAMYLNDLKKIKT
ncbi:HAD-IIB family hydrolase [Sulfurimonas sp. MAG313]|nr:HAD-IIB family hydrolase [Sulfurimonas sp. MAG313]MDF1881796.1 HAD-IIB family hydrolase [Sulfurimonas sp. MAG313]